MEVLMLKVISFNIIGICIVVSLIIHCKISLSDYISTARQDENNGIKVPQIHWNVFVIVLNLHTSYLTLIVYLHIKMEQQQRKIQF